MKTVEEELEFYKNAYKHASEELAKYPKGSFICLSVESVHGTVWKSVCSMYVDDHDSVRRNNEILKMYNSLRGSGMTGEIRYVENGVLTVPGSVKDLRNE